MDVVAETVEKILRSMFASFCSVVYRLVSFLYELFMNVSKIKILTQADIQPIYKRVTLILALIMIFYVTFEVVKYIISPDTLSDKEKGAGNIVKKMIIVVVLIAAVPTLFSKAFDIQTMLFENQVFSKIILGKQNIEASTYGRSFAANVFSMFYRIDDNMWDESDLKGKCDGVDCDTIVEANLSSLAEGGVMPFLQLGLNAGAENKINSNKKTFYITFDGLWALLVGLFISWVLLMYVIDAGTRIAQLAFLQIIAPIPIIGYLSPEKDGIFQKWYKQCFATYISLFLRLSIIYIILLICGILDKAYKDGTLFTGIGNNSFGMQSFIYITLLIGLLTFGKRAPKMLEELFPKLSTATGNLGFSLKDRAPGVAKLAARGVGAGIGALSSGVKMAKDRAVNTRRRNKALEELTGESAGARRKASRTARKTRKNARRDYKDAVKAARDKKVDVLDKYGKPVVDRRSGKVKQRHLTAEEFSAATKKDRDTLRAAESAYASARSKQNKSVFGNAIAGAGRGATVGAKQGAGATSLGEIRKKVQEGRDATKKELEGREQWLDAGGYSERDRRRAERDKRRGYITTADVLQKELKTYEGRIQSGETLIARETDVGSKVDAAKSTAGSRLDSKKLKTVIPAGTALTYTDIDGTKKTLDLTKHGGAGSEAHVAYSLFEQEATRTREQSTAASQALQALKAEKTKTEATIRTTMKAKQATDPTITDADIDAAVKSGTANIDAAITTAQTDYDNASKAAAVAEHERRAAHDLIEQYAVTRALQGHTDDGNTSTGVEAAKASLIEAARDQSTVDEMRIQLLSVGETKHPGDPNAAKAWAEEMLAKFTDPNGEADPAHKILEFDDLDEIQKALRAVADKRSITVASYKGSKERLEASDQLGASKADENSGKQ